VTFYTWQLFFCHFKPYNMKYTLSIILLLIIIPILFTACKKSQNGKNAMPAYQEIIESAKDYFHTYIENPKQGSSGVNRVDAAKTIDWQVAYVANLSHGPCVIVPIHYVNDLLIKSTAGGENLFSLNDITHLIIYKGNTNTYHAEIITAFPDTIDLKSSTQGYTGFVLVENWSGQRLHQFKYNADGSILEYRPQTAMQSHPSTISSSDKAIQPNALITVCYEIDGYNYGVNDPDGGYAWTESLGCTSMYLPDSRDGGGGGTGGNGGAGGVASGSDYGAIAGSSRPLPKIALVTKGPNIIANIQDYFKCFTNVGGSDHTYTVTVCVDQPVPGTREPWRLQSSPGSSSAASNPVDVGHTFLIFSETSGGKTITRNVGFYPNSAVYPWSQSAQGQLNDNEGTSYNISLTVTITNAQFFNMLNYVSQGNNPGYLYDMSTNNCTTFVIHALQAGFVNLSSQIGSWTSGSGYDPGDLGEDIRTIPLSSNMSRNTVENPHPNVGNCI